MRKTPMLLLMVVAGITMMALGCPPTARPPVTPPAEPPPPEPTPEPPPPPPETEMRWTIGPDDFGDDDATIWAQTSNRSGPYEWDRISAGNVRVSIGGKELTATGENPPAFTSTWHEPAFDSDLTGAEWTVTAEVRAGAVVLVLTAPDQTYYDGPVVRVRMTSGGSGYASPPTVTFGGGGDGDAVGVAVGPGMVTGVTITAPGNGYLSPPTISFTGAGADAAATAVVGGSVGSVVDVIITNGGSGYTSDPTVGFTSPPTGSTAAGDAVVERSVTSVRVTHGGDYRTSPPVTFGSGGGGSGAAGVAVLQRRGNDEFQNLYFARRTLYGKELLVQFTGE